MRRVLIGLFALAAFLVVARVTWAQDGGPVTDDEVNRVAKQLYCPVCENIPLDVCPTQACTQWRATIREKLVAGWSEQQIKDYFAAQYGERVLAAPTSDGFTVLVWIIPPIAVIAGAVGLWAFMRRAVQSAPTAASTPSDGEAEIDPYLARLEQELERRR
ncbi:MAG: cytochrome c-type biogenesis protein CcmH [Anaerolineales bacterium]|nr:cytochrome c-type biogenesis protein CcmH [Anaerolineales bacterium]